LNAITHRIEKVFVEVNTSNLESATIFKNKIGRFLETEVFPKLEQTLDELNQTGRVARIDSLNLKIATLRDDFFNTLESEIVKQFSAKIESEIGFSGKKINEGNVTEKIEIITTDQNREKVFLFFLENGHLPWFGTEEEVSEFLQLSNWEKSLENPEFISRLIHLLKSENSVAERFVFQLDKKLLITFLLKIKPEISKAKKNILTLFQRLPSKTQSTFFRFLFAASTGNEMQKITPTARLLSNALLEIIQQKNENLTRTIHTEFTGFFEKADLIPNAEQEKISEMILDLFENFKPDLYDLKEKKDAIPDAIQKEKETKQESFLNKKEDEIAVQNAGLVLLHPFLKSFFKNQKLLDEQGNILVARRHLAVQMVHYLATGEEDFFESNLVFSKFLCGVPLEIPVPRESLLTQSDKNEANLLLSEVIKHWAALKNTSPGGLRQMFLQRNGKLFKKEKNYRLIVERKAQDVLLDKLSWNISLVKLSWWNELLYIEWQ
jgi:hypothetical protein